MQELLFMLIGVTVGSIITQLIIRFGSGKGYFLIEEISPEDGLYSINMRLIKDQNLHKKKRIILTREYDTDFSSK